MLGLYAAHPALIWLGLGAALLAVEILTGSGWLLWAAASAGVVAGAAAVAGELSATWAIAGFAALTIVSTLTARRFLPRGVANAPGRDINDNSARVVGLTGQVITAFNRGQGRVFVDGKEWAAAQDGEGAPAVGDIIRVTGADGARLTVRGA